MRFHRRALALCIAAVLLAGPPGRAPAVGAADRWRPVASESGPSSSSVAAPASREVDPPVEPIAGRVYFAETGPNLGGRFREYWEAGGGLAQFGFPLGEPFEEELGEGKGHVVQYSERARFEYHQENAPPCDVLLGQFGRQILAGVEDER